MKKTRCLILILLSVLIISCQAQNPVSPDTTYPSQIRTSSQSSYVFYKSYQEMAAVSDAVVLGRPTGEIGIVNTSRNISDVSKPAADNFGVGQVYEFSVDEYLQGDGPKTVFIVQNQGSIILSQEKQIPSPEEFNSAKEEWGGYKLAIGQRYLIFLFKFDYEYVDYPKDSIFGMCGHPGRFIITDKDCVILEDEAGLESYYPPVSLDYVRLKLEGKESVVDPSAYPASSDLEIVNGCADPASEVLPYP